MQKPQHENRAPAATPPRTLADGDRASAPVPNGPTPDQVRDAKQGGRS